ncbi:class I SAM-dependent methyltransferase [Nonomuraea sp. NPDC049400]|uniref:class I SAM-dependent methyltransferase n=1 Tax=Nonomuraea sp. NPDC049400 TaxID=3364352 RepID=UPI00378E9771
MSAWLDAWNGDQSLYVNDRHRRCHYSAMAEEIVALLPPGAGRVLDYGPGEALSAGRVAEVCREVILCEAADTMRAALAARFARHPGVTVIGQDGLARLADRSVDLIVVHSVVQYLTADELNALLRAAHRLLAPGGRLVLSDLVPPGAGLLSDAVELLRFAFRAGFLVAAVASLARTAFSPYSRARRRRGLTRLDERRLTILAGQARLTGRRLPANLGNNRARWAFLAHRADVAAAGE